MHVAARTLHFRLSLTTTAVRGSFVCTVMLGKTRSIRRAR